VLTTRVSLNRIFADFDVKLPVITNIVRSAVFVWFVGALFGLTIIKELLLKNRNVRTTWNIIIVLLSMVLCVLYVLAMVQPIIVLIEKLSK